MTWILYYFWKALFKLRFPLMTVINEENTNNKDKLKLEDIPILREYLDVFPEEILGLPLKRELDFTIELVPGAVPNSKAT